MHIKIGPHNGLGSLGSQLWLVSFESLLHSQRLRLSPSLGVVELRKARTMQEGFREQVGRLVANKRLSNGSVVETQPAADYKLETHHLSVCGPAAGHWYSEAATADHFFYPVSRSNPQLTASPPARAGKGQTATDSHSCRKGWPGCLSPNSTGSFGSEEDAVTLQLALPRQRLWRLTGLTGLGIMPLSMVTMTWKGLAVDRGLR